MQTESLGMEPRRKSQEQAPLQATLIPLSPLGKLASPSLRTSVLLAEVVILPLLFLVVGFWLSPTNPLWVKTEFPWAWLAPIVIALRYGALAGLGSSAILLVGWIFLHHGQWQEFPQLYFLGGLITVMVVGEFSSLWRAQTRRAETAQHYLEQRLEHLVRQYYLLRLSHDRLEQELIGRPMSMRDALQKLNTSSGAVSATDNLLQLLAQYCQITDASLHAISNEQILPQAVAHIGSQEPLDLGDPLLRQALEMRKLCHVVESLEGEQQSRYLIAAPLLDLRGDLYAMLVVKEMPFFALQTENLQVINLLLGYYTDGLSAKELALPLLARFPSCPENFAVELQRLAHMQQSTGIGSVVVVLEFTQEAISRSVPRQILRMKRLLDEIWHMEPQAGKQVLAILMPLGTTATAEGFLQRLEQWALRKQRSSLMEAGIFPHVYALKKYPPPKLLQRITELQHA